MTGVHIMLAEWSPSSPSLALSMPSGDVKNGVSKRLTGDVSRLYTRS